MFPKLSMAPVEAIQQPAPPIYNFPSNPPQTTTPPIHPKRSISTPVPIPSPPLRLNSNPHRLCLRNNTLTNPLQAQPTQPQLTLLNLRNLINMLQTNRPHNLIRMSALQLPLHRLHLRRTQQQVTRSRRPHFEVE